MAQVIVDTGPLVAFLDAGDSNHEWAVSQFRKLTGALLTCEPVLTELAFLTFSRGMAPENFYQLFRRGIIGIDFDLSAHWEALERMMKSYSDLPMSIADACLVRMSETKPESVVFTLDRDFTIYRRNRRRKIPLLAPFH